MNSATLAGSITRTDRKESKKVDIDLLKPNNKHNEISPFKRPIMSRTFLLVISRVPVEFDLDPERLDVDFELQLRNTRRRTAGHRGIQEGDGHITFD